MTAITDSVRRALDKLVPGAARADAPAEPVAAPLPGGRRPRRRGRTKSEFTRVLRTDDAWRVESDQWKDLDARIKSLSELRTASADRLSALEPENSASGNGVDLTRSWRGGPPKWEAVVDDGLMTVEQVDSYRPPEREVVSISRTRGPSNGVRPDVGTEAHAVWTPQAAPLKEGQK